MNTRELSIGRLSQGAGCKAETIRYYERIGMMPEPPRTQGGHRAYSQAHLERLRFICRSRSLGFTLAQVRDLLRLVDHDNYSCTEVQTVTLAHLQGVQQRIADLKRLEQVLKHMVQQCEDGQLPNCPVIEALSRD